MLTQITISHLITIEKLQLELSSGTTVITGESGVGKSILIDAIELALGARAASDCVRPDQEKADICLTFDLTNLPEARQWLQNYDLQNENECLIRRTIFRDGRSRSYINNMPTTLQPLRELSELLINIHGQHEHQTLLKTDVQRTLLDKYANHENIVFKVQHLSEEWHRLQRELLELKTKENDRAARLDYLNFQLQELNELHLTPNEFETLDREHKQLAHGEELLQHAHLSLAALADEEEKNAIYFLNRTLHALEHVQHLDPKMASCLETLKNAHIQLSEVEDDLRRYLDTFEIDPEKFKQTEERISLLFNLARKHKIDPHELYSFQQQLQTELNELSHSSEKIAEFALKLTELKQAYDLVAKELTQSRQKAAKKLEKQITPLIQSLSLPHGKFKVTLEPLNNESLHTYGQEKIIFEIQTNPDQPIAPLAKIASGGELSRISLAIHIATAKEQTMPTLIFDEIDVGVSGQTAATIGKLLHQLGESLQVLCVTHVPQVASQGHQHLRVEKKIKNDTTFTSIHSLTKQEKIKEIARMLGGKQVTEKTLAHAEEMLEDG